MQDVINGGVYAVDLQGTESYEFKGIHPALVIKMLKEEKMYYVVPLTTYNKERWDKCKRKGFGTRIISTNSIARVDKLNIVSEKQVQSRYYNGGKLVIPTSNEVEAVMHRVEEYIKLADEKAERKYKKFLLQRMDFENAMEILLKRKGFGEFAYPLVIDEDITFEYPCSQLSYIDTADIKDIINCRIKCSGVLISKVGANMGIRIKINQQDLLTFSKEYDKFRVQKGDSDM